MSYNVFLISYIGAPRDHHSLFIETDPDSASGLLLHVKGNIQNGMEFEERSTNNPEKSMTFVDKSHLGCVNAADLDHMRHLCQSIPPPKKQFSGPKRLYPKEPLRRCQEWTNEAIDALTVHGVLQQPITATTEASVQEEYWSWSAENQNWYHVHQDGSYEWATEEQSSNGERSREGKHKGKDRGRA